MPRGVPPIPRGGPRGGPRGAGERAGGRREARGGRGPVAARVRSRGVKITHAAAAGVRAGHPWVFRESVERPLDNVPVGTVLPLADEDGQALGWGLVEPEGAIALRILSREADFSWGAEEIRGRVRAALALRERWLEPSVRGACRLVHAEGDGLPGLAVDRYGDYLVVVRYARSAAAFTDTLVEVLAAEVEPAGIYLQERIRGVQPEDRRDPAKLVHGKAAPVEVEVVEDELRFLVDPTAPVSPGLFLDLREGRRLVERSSAGRRVLNLFSYTGAFSLRAVRGGAESVVAVDASAKAHARCRRNLQASGMSPDACLEVVGDTFRHLERFRQRGDTFDLVVVDPPPFSKVGGQQFSALRQWRDLAQAVCEVMAPAGRVLAVCNAAGLPSGELMRGLGEGAARAGRALRIVGELGLPPDFPVPPSFTEGRYLRVIVLDVE